MVVVEGPSDDVYLHSGGFVCQVCDLHDCSGPLRTKVDSHWVDAERSSISQRASDDRKQCDTSDAAPIEIASNHESGLRVCERLYSGRPHSAAHRHLLLCQCSCLSVGKPTWPTALECDGGDDGVGVATGGDILRSRHLTVHAN